jgi:hypothetical protein
VHAKIAMTVAGKVALIIVHAKIAMTVAGKVSLIRLDFSRSMHHCRQLNTIKQAKETKKKITL